MKNNKLDKTSMVVFIFLTVWGAIQILRFIAIPLIIDILNKKENESWMFPAILDTIVALGSFFFLYVLWLKRNFATWLYSFLYLFISIVDHIDGAVAGALSTTPQLFGGPQRDHFGLILSLLIPAVIDVVALFLLNWKKIREKFFEISALV
ncbi:MAG: hypothetical protein PHP42_12505 [Bacteroidota bacterium]|nr:hypothetical protein [Bacteroidota bacterium]